MKRTFFVLCSAFLALGAGLLTPPLAAAPFVVTDAKGSTAVFDLLAGPTSSDLLVTLTNNAPGPLDVLTGLAFTAVHDLVPVSASIQPPSSIRPDIPPNNFVVSIGEGWRYTPGLLTSVGPGVGNFVPAGQGQPLSFPAYGIITDRYTGPGPGPLVDNSIQFDLSADPAVTLDEIAGVQILYGPAAATPEPASWLLMAIGGFLLWWRGARR